MDPLDAIKIFVRVVESGSFSAAARELGVGQPAASKQVASCGSGFWGVQRPSLAHYVTGMGPMDGATAAGRRSCCLSSEELVAELGSAFLRADLGVTPEPREDHSAYLAHWIALWHQRMVAVGEPHSHETAVRQEDVVGEEKQDLSRSQISRRRLTMTSRLWPSVGVMTARAPPPNRRTAGAPRTAMRRRFSRMCRCSAARRP